MEPIHNLLIATDLTRGADRLLGRVQKLPLSVGARITLLHVVPGGMTDREGRSGARDARRQLAEDARALQAALPVRATMSVVVRVGAVAKEICADAASAGAEVIVIGRGSGRAVADAFLGSTAERVVRQSRLPVLVVRRAARATYRRPALAVDFDKAAPEALGLMLRLLPSPFPPVTVIHAFDEPYHNVIYPSISDAADERKVELARRAGVEIRKLITTALKKATLPSTLAPLWRFHLRYGHPRGVIKRAIKSIDADLLTLGTRGRTGASHLFFGTVAGDVLRQAGCDVLLVPPAASRGSASRR